MDRTPHWREPYTGPLPTIGTGPTDSAGAVSSATRRARWRVTHPQAPGTRLVGANVGAHVLSLPGGTYTDITLDPAQGWVWKRDRPWWCRFLRELGVYLGVIEEAESA